MRYRQRKARRIQASQSGSSSNSRDRNQLPSTPDQAQETAGNQTTFDGQVQQEQANPDEAPEPEGRWTRSTLNFYLGILTTLLVVTAWITNLIAKPLATAFGGSVAALGMLIAYTNYRFHLKKGRVPVATTGVEPHLPGAILAVLSTDNPYNEAIIKSAASNPDKKPVVFLFLGKRSNHQKPELFRLIEPHLSDEQARHVLGRANYLARQANLDTRFVYRHQKPDAAYRVWQELHPRETIVAPDQADALQQIHPDRTYDESTPEGRLVHLLKDSTA
jgi:hypothetical protein